MAVDKYTLAYLKRKEELEKKTPPQRTLLERVREPARTLPAGGDMAGRPTGTATGDGAAKSRGSSSAAKKMEFQKPKKPAKAAPKRVGGGLPTEVVVPHQTDPVWTAPAQVSPQEMKTEMLNRRIQGNYTLPGSLEETVANLKKEQEQLSQRLSSLRQSNAGGVSAFSRSGLDSQGRRENIGRVSDKFKQVERELEEAQKALWEQIQEEGLSSLEQVRSAPDFKEAVAAGRAGDYSKIEWGLPTADQVLYGMPRGRKIARYLTDPQYAANTDAQAMAGYANTTDADLAFLSDDEKSVMLYYAGKGEFDKMEEYYKQLIRTLDARRQGKESEQTQKMSKEHPILGAGYNIASSFFSPLSYVGNALQAGKNALTGEYEPTNQNSAWFRSAHAVNDTAAGVSEAAKSLPVVGKVEIKGKNLGSFLAETGLSMGQFLSKIPLGGAGGLAYVGSGAAGQTTLDTLERGGTPDQALTMGTASGLIEVATEKIGLDRLLNIAGSAGKTGVRRALLDIGGQMLTEGGEEAISEVANNLVDLAVMDDKAELSMYVRELMDGGMSQEEAESTALKQFFLANTAWAAAGGAVSGGVMGAGAEVVSGLRGRSEQRTNSAIDNAYSTMQERGLFTPEARAAADKANRRLGFLPTGEDSAGTESRTGRLLTGTEWEAGVKAAPFREAPAAESAPSQERPAAESEAVVPPPQAARSIPGGEEIHIDERTWEDAGKRKVRAFQYDHPELHQFYADAARGMLYDLQNSIKGERSPIKDADGYITGYTGTKRSVSGPVEMALDDAKLSYQQIETALHSLIEDHGQENYAAAKKVELVLDTMLSEGYTDADWIEYGPDEAYLTAKAALARQLPDGLSDYHMSEEEWISLMAQAPGPESSVGAAQSGFDPYSHFQGQKSEFHPDGEKAYRQVDVPTTDLDGRRISKSAATVMEAQAIPDEMIGEIQNMILDGKFSYDRITDKGAMQRAEKTILDIGFDGAVEKFSQAARDGKAGKDLMALGATLLNNAANSRDGKTMAIILADYASMSRAGAQATQANRLLKKMSPQWQLAAIQRTVDNLNGKIRERVLGKELSGQTDIQFDPALLEKFLSAPEGKARDAALDEIYQNVADQVPSTWRDKWDAWRYLSMLGNLRTHVRNVIGNAGFAPVRAIKNEVGAALEHLVSAATGGKVERTKSFVFRPDLYKAALADFRNVQDIAMGGGKFDDASGKIHDKRTIFKNNGTWGTLPGSPTVAKAARTVTGMLQTGLEAARKGNSWLLEVEDSFFLKSAYADSLAGYLTAHDVTAQELRAGTVEAGLLDEARAYAVKEAQKATYRDSNAFSDWVAKLGSKARNSDNAVIRGLGVVGEGVLPFKRTPANILVRGVEYSPVGLVKGVVDTVQAARGKGGSVSEALDTLASGMTGTGLFALGMLLNAMGAVSGGGSGDDDKDRFNDLTGKQDYSMRLPDGTWVTLDWLAPEALPFFMGVETANLGDVNGYKLENLTEALKRLSDPMMEMSMLQSLNDILEHRGYEDTGLGDIVASALTSYFTQGLPTIAGQLERAGDEKRMTTYADKNGWLPTGAQYVLGKAANKLPGVDYRQIPYIDAWGRTEDSGPLPLRAFNNLANPAFLSTENMTGLDKELERLYQQTGDGGVLPDRAGKYITVAGARKDLSAEQFVQYATKKGTTAFETAEAVTKTALYGKLTDSQKAQAIKDAYTYADAVAKKGLGLGYEPDKWVDSAQNMDTKTRAALLAARVLLADGEDAGEKRDILRGAKLPEEQKIQVYRVLISDSKDEEIQKLKAAGLSFDDFLLAQNKRGEIEDMDAKASQKAAEFAHWASQEGYSAEQVTALREVFQFYSFVPSDEIKYDDFKEAGFDEDQAYALSGALADVGGIHGDKDANGNSVYLSASRKKKEAIDKATPGLSQQERRIIYEMFGVSKKVW